MTRFRYRAVNPAGDLIEGEVDGQDQSAVVDQLRRQGNLLLATEPVDRVTGRVTYSQQILKEFGWITEAVDRRFSGYSQI